MAMRRGRRIFDSEKTRGFRITPLFAVIIGLLVIARTSLAGSATPVFYKDILPILQDHCQSCHRAGEIAPMPLVTYAQAKPYARAIREMVKSKKMPPWFADARYGRFVNDPSLSE